MPTRDRRTVGELLLDADAIAREALLDMSPEAAPAMLRTFPQVAQSAARLWSVLPPPSLAPAQQPDLMVRLQAVGRGIGRSVTVGRWPGSGPSDERLAQVAYNLARAAVLVERHGRDVQPTTPQARADIAAARARVMHTLYVAVHGTSVAVTGYAKDLQDQRDRAVRRHSPLSDRPNPRDIAAATGMLNRLDVLEQLAGTYVADHPVTLAALGEDDVPTRATRLDSALARWDIQTHRSLASNPDPADLVRVARVQALLVTTTAVIVEAAAEKGKLDQATVQRLSPVLDATQIAWTQVARRWSELTMPGRSDPALVRAASDVRAAVAATAHTTTGWATPEQLAARLDFAKTAQTLKLSMVASVDVGYLTREVAALGQSPRTPARVSDAGARLGSENAVQRGQARSTGKIVVTRGQPANTEFLPLAESVRRGLVKVSNELLASAVSAVAAAACLEDRRQATTNRSAAQRRSSVEEQHSPSAGRRQGPSR
ncbi:MAG TPA: hypothetical protein VF635_03965 [Propionibacteriaceae bacterium]